MLIPTLISTMSFEKFVLFVLMLYIQSTIFQSCWDSLPTVLRSKVINWASMQQNWSSGFPTNRDSNQSPQLQRLARKLKFILLVASLDMIISEKGITKALISLRGWAGWSAPLLFAPPPPRRQDFSCRGSTIRAMVLKIVKLIRDNEWTT